MKMEQNKVFVYNTMVWFSFETGKGFAVDDYEDVETIEECREMATIDCCDEYEQASGWLNTLLDVFCEVKKVKIFGEEVKFKGLDLVNEFTIVAVIEKKKKEAKVTLDSLEFINLTKAQKLWLEAWSDWSK